MKRIGVSVLILLTFSFLQPTNSFACSCIQPPPPEIAFEESDAVFIGKLISFEKVGGAAGISDNPELNPGRKAVFQVQNVWKGFNTEKVTIYTGMDSASCGINFQSDTEYVIYANQTKDGKLLYTGLCTRTAEVKAAKNDLAFLNELEPLPLSEGMTENLENGAGSSSDDGTKDDENNNPAEAAVQLEHVEYYLLAMAGVVGLLAVFVLRRKRK